MSDYLGQAYMAQLARPKATDVVLEIGTGSGFQASLLSRIVKKAYSIEIIQDLGASVAKIFGPLKLHKHRDARRRWLLWLARGEARF
jgi:protein-L-isoaspartate(D-aspartate) O-methyltransferase